MLLYYPRRGLARVALSPGKWYNTVLTRGVCSRGRTFRGGDFARGAAGGAPLWGLSSQRPVPGPPGAAGGGPRGAAAGGQRVGQRAAPVAARRCWRSLWASPPGPVAGAGDSAGAGRRGAGGLPPPFPPGLWGERGPLRFCPAEIPVGGAGRLGVFLLFGVALLPLGGRRGVLQPGHLRGHEHAPELFDQPGKPGGLSPGLLLASRHPALLPLFVGQHLRQPVPAGRAVVVCLPAAHVGGGGPGALWAVRLFLRHDREPGPGGPGLGVLCLQRGLWVFLLFGRRCGKLHPHLHRLLRDAHQPGGGEHPLGQRAGGYDAPPAGYAVWLGGAVPGAVPAVPGGLPGAAAVLFPGGPYGRAPCP